MKKSLKKFKLPLDWATNPNLCDGRMQQDTPYNILPSNPNIKPKATLGEQAFLFATPKLWNVLPGYIRESISIDTFKGKLKTHLFKSFSILYIYYHLIFHYYYYYYYCFFPMVHLNIFI